MHLERKRRGYGKDPLSDNLADPTGRAPLVLFALGTNMGIKRIVATGGHGESERVGRQLNKASPSTPYGRRCTSPTTATSATDSSPTRAAQALCLTLVVNCVAAFNAGFLTPAVE
jgi:hypothetical protein